MKLSPLDIQHMEFSSALNGYSKKQVREFLERVADEREGYLRELMALRDELQEKDATIAELQSAEAELKRAVIAAERIGNELKENARREAELTVREAEQVKENIMREAKARLKEARAELSRIEREQGLFREQFRGLLHAFERSLDAAPSPRRGGSDRAPERGQE